MGCRDRRPRSSRRIPGRRSGAARRTAPRSWPRYLRAIRWRSATAADRDLLQAPFRAGIRLDAYQLLPLRKALRLPRVNLLIADDVGLGKTVEAGLVARELLLRRRIDFIVIAAPPAMTMQWKDELESKFGLSFDIIDRERIGELRRLRGFSVNPWTTGSRFIISHSLLTEETYVAGLARHARRVPLARPVHPGRGAPCRAVRRRALRDLQPADPRRCANWPSASSIACS